ncbi:GNAT family acetyltransferase [Bacillus manliponensis]|uniref:GNAT family acetyltransferase n=1 Tax=Bacillus manliponensis TaxID=574376 RepID=A0A073K0S3_9BACI|nr:GNAT family N-acetyltransferase [Bacillus manliponensis]KEK20037.1 GNAT family acetyltransferase [Bacillus manliponensis]
MTFTIKHMNEDDIAAVQEVAIICWHDTYEGILPKEVREAFLEQLYSHEMMKRRLEQSHLFVAEVEDKVVGFANFSSIKYGGEAELGAIYILPQHQGTGIGTALLQKGILYLESVKKLYVCVEAENDKGKSFYKAKGFSELERFEEDFEGHTLQTMRMVLHI